MPLSGQQVLYRYCRPQIVVDFHLYVVEREPDLMRIATQRHGSSRDMGAIRGGFDESCAIGIVDCHEAEIAGLLQGGVGAAGEVERSDIGLEIAGPIPIADLDLVFLGVE